MRISDWSSDVCSSDLPPAPPLRRGPEDQGQRTTATTPATPPCRSGFSRELLISPGLSSKARAVTARKPLILTRPDSIRTLTGLEPPHPPPAAAERRLAPPVVDHQPADHHHPQTGRAACRVISSQHLSYQKCYV